MRKELIRLVLLEELKEEKYYKEEREVLEYSTKSVILEDEIVEGELNVLALKNTGVVEEFLAIALNPEFKLRIEVDSEVLVDQSFNTLLLISEHSDRVDAYYSKGKCVVRVSNIYFKNSFRLDIYARKVKFEKIIVLYKVKV